MYVLFAVHVCDTVIRSGSVGEAGFESRKTSAAEAVLAMQRAARLERIVALLSFKWRFLDWLYG
jgi:hypothetical protein